MVTLEAERILSARVDAITICQHVRVWVKLTQDRSIGHNFLLDSFFSLSDAEINDLIEKV